MWNDSTELAPERVRRTEIGMYAGPEDVDEQGLNTAVKLLITWMGAMLAMTFSYGHEAVRGAQQPPR